MNTPQPRHVVLLQLVANKAYDAGALARFGTAAHEAFSRATRQLAGTGLDGTVDVGALRNALQRTELFRVPPS
jgi:hypothetical protein